MQLFCSRMLKQICPSHWFYFDQWESTSNPRLETGIRKSAGGRKTAVNWSSNLGLPFSLDSGYLTPGFCQLGQVSGEYHR
ncbi:hypothetical protein TNIN_83501 [Trichonephila inaurata madagascariensis]|uniref:Uncharacterized protein n=1 Tax=Trichonephila inaurata madagascariensis TaxID=2747483 RepID=A0A8X6YPH1_9ARAC|nr:hypothetical protein TNIN_83491 [Trichonephila inaurata madagascariensis]GFY74593.1 hypothetical protein TNIN_83501 [Trichonephila inaurata madagascariensis]